MQRTDPPTRDTAAYSRGMAVTRAGLGLLAALAAGACHRASPWTNYAPDDSQHQREFVKLTKDLDFVVGTTKHKPLYSNATVDVAIDPEGTVEHFEVGKQQYDNAHFGTDAGRILAKLTLEDPNADFPPLLLTQANKKTNYAIWWVETGGKPDTSGWTNHYYLVDPTAETVKEIVPDSGMPPRKFVFIAEQDFVGSQPVAGLEQTRGYLGLDPAHRPQRFNPATQSA